MGNCKIGNYNFFGVDILMSPTTQIEDNIIC